MELITVARKQIQGSSAFTAASSVTAEMLVVGDESLLILADLSAADRVDPTKSFWVRVYLSSDGGLTFTPKPTHGMRFIGHPENSTTGPIGLVVVAAELVGTHVRVELDVPVRMGLGFTATITRTLPF